LVPGAKFFLCFEGHDDGGGVSEPKKKKPGRPKKVKKNESEQPENLVSSSCQVNPEFRLIRCYDFLNIFDEKFCEKNWRF
jgi:hypothetical protein